MSAKRFYLVPAGLSELVLRNQWFRHLQVYMALKHSCRGQTIINGKLISALAHRLSVSTKTVERSVAFCRQRDWIGFNHESGLSFIRGFDAVRRIEKITNKRSYWFDMASVGNTKSYSIASCYAETIRKKRLAEVHKKERSNQKASLSFYPIPLGYFAKIHGCTKSTTSVYRKLADAQGFINVKRDLRPISEDQYEVIMNSNDPDEIKRIVRLRDATYQQFSDRIKVNLRPKKRRPVFRTKSEPYSKRDIVGKYRLLRSHQYLKKGDVLDSHNGVVEGIWDSASKSIIPFSNEKWFEPLCERIEALSESLAAESANVAESSHTKANFRIL